MSHPLEGVQRFLLKYYLLISILKQTNSNSDLYKVLVSVNSLFNTNK